MMFEKYGACEGLPLSKADVPVPLHKSPSWVNPDLPELPEEQNGPLGTFGQIVNTMVGSGILAMPSVLAQVGLAYTTGMLIFFCTIVGASSLMMIDAGRKLGVMDYSLIVERSLGRRWRLANDLAVFVGLMGALTSYMNVIGSLGSRVAEYIQPHGWAVLNTYPGFMVVLVTAVIALEHEAVVRRTHVHIRFRGTVHSGSYTLCLYRGFACHWCQSCHTNRAHRCTLLLEAPWQFCIWNKLPAGRL